LVFSFCTANWFFATSLRSLSNWLPRHISHCYFLSAVPSIARYYSWREGKVISAILFLDVSSFNFILDWFDLFINGGWFLLGPALWERLNFLFSSMCFLMRLS
jgi:hypothetical protein